jgi:hypothetical protein
MAESVVNRETVEAFLEACGNTNFQVIARGVTTSGAAKGTLQKDTRYPYGESETKVKDFTTGLRDGITTDGATRVFKQAKNLAEGDDWYRAIASLVECGYYQQVELCAMEYITVKDVWGEQKNPAFSTLERLIWRCEDDGKVTTHGGAREGAGRPSLGGKPVIVDMPTEMISDLNAKAKERGIARAELVREAVRKLLAE